MHERRGPERSRKALKLLLNQDNGNNPPGCEKAAFYLEDHILLKTVKTVRNRA